MKICFEPSPPSWIRRWALVVPQLPFASHAQHGRHSESLESLPKEVRPFFAEACAARISRRGHHLIMSGAGNNICWPRLASCRSGTTCYQALPRGKHQAVLSPQPTISMSLFFEGPGKRWWGNLRRLHPSLVKRFLCCDYCVGFVPTPCFRCFFHILSLFTVFSNLLHN